MTSSIPGAKDVGLEAEIETKGATLNLSCLLYVESKQLLGHHDYNLKSTLFPKSLSAAEASPLIHILNGL